MTPDVLSITGATKSYAQGGFWKHGKRLDVLKGIDLTIEADQCVGLIGPSGAGKSTLGRLLLGLEPPDQGDVTVMGQTITGRTTWNKELRRAIQVVFQNALDSCNPRMTTRAILAEPLRNFDQLSGSALEHRVDELLKMVELSPDDKDKLPSQFSGGQLQRICIARALAPRPALIVLDEAVSALDMVIQAQMLDLLDRLRQVHKTAYLFITHDLRLIRRFCDRTFLLDDGRLVEFSPVTFQSDRPLPLLEELQRAIPPGRPEPRALHHR